MKQTAVEWFNDEILIHLNFDQRLYLKDIVQQAKAMEKEQIIEAYDAGLFDGTMDDVNDRMHKQYYNETFKSE